MKFLWQRTNDNKYCKEYSEFGARGAASSHAATQNQSESEYDRNRGMRGEVERD